MIRECSVMEDFNIYVCVLHSRGDHVIMITRFNELQRDDSCIMAVDTL